MRRVGCDGARFGASHGDRADARESAIWRGGFRVPRSWDFEFVYWEQRGVSDQLAFNPTMTILLFDSDRGSFKTVFLSGCGLFVVTRL